MDWPTGSYSTIYVDPPWPEFGGGRIKRGADRHYPLMSVREIEMLPVGLLGKSNSHLYLWTTNNYLADAIRIVGTWGYRYITCVTWMKDRMGLGQYYRGLTEHCLFGVRGNLPYRTLNGKRSQGVTGFYAPRGEHSAKPEQMRQMIEMVSPPEYIELFARRPVEGWTVWGDEVL